MKYCTSCRKLHNDNEETCTQCRKALKTVEDENTPVFLISAEGFEKERIIAALADEGIPTDTKRMKKDNSAKAVTGVDMSDVKILVPYQAYEKAYDICVGIGAIKEENEEIIDDGEYKESDAKPLDRQLEEINGGSKAGRIILAIMFLVLAALAVFGTDAITGFISKLITGN
ncbi:MAG: hypothetical protein ACI4W1_04710 [Ruminococcus sp.]